MPYNPVTHHRRSIRLKGYDYTQPGVYFISLVTWQRQTLLGEIIHGEMHLGSVGKIVEAHWLRMPEHFSICLDAWVIMPDHFHGILIIGGGEGEAFADPHQKDLTTQEANASPLQPNGTCAGSLGAIIQNFKSITTRKINTLLRSPGAAVWQRNYYERIIRSQAEWQRTRDYIQTNPQRWTGDRRK